MMKSILPYGQVSQLAHTDVAYASGHPDLLPFCACTPGLDAFPALLEARARYPVARQVLTEVLTAQYASVAAGKAVRDNLHALGHADTYTVTTAHQPALFTGPLYTIYKAISTIRLATAAQKALGPPYRVVPVFVMGSEDHDLEELNHARLFGKTISWTPDQTGPVGAMTTDTLDGPLSELHTLLGDSEPAKALFDRVRSAYAPGQTFAEATRRLLNDLLGQHGLLVISLESPALKRLFIPVIKDELLHQTAQAKVTETIEALEALGYKAQAPPRPINLFYMMPGLRERITLEDGHYTVLHTKYRFTTEEMLREAEQFPERFSPNVLLRPLYQEMVLPNLAYVGGGGELAYWLERKAHFGHYGVPFPMLVRRHSVLWLDKDSIRKRVKFGFRPEQLFLDTDALVRNYVAAQADAALSVTDEVEAVQEAYKRLSLKAKEVDPTLEKAVLADGVKAEQALRHWESRLLRAGKQRHEVSVQQIRMLKDKLFPGNNGLQERSDNVLPYLLKHGQGFLDTLMAHLEPFDPGFVVLEDAAELP
jgi:bacillithiol biosynthesis cysteine-adding enzyme BshC